MGKNIPPIPAGAVGTITLLLFYFLTMRLLEGTWYAAFSQFEALWYLMIPLSVGFGVQVALYKKIRDMRKTNSAKNVMMANTAASTAGMIACCAHHLTDILPVIGLSALSTLLVNYQTPILVIGIVSNILGIRYLYLSVIRYKNNSYLRSDKP